MFSPIDKNGECFSICAFVTMNAIILYLYNKIEFGTKSIIIFPLCHIHLLPHLPPTKKALNMKQMS